MTVIGVTDDTRDIEPKVAKYITDNNIHYPIALRGGARYTTRGIPAAWVVSPAGMIVWQGSPNVDKADMDAAIQEYLPDAFALPRFVLSKPHQKAKAYLNAGLMSKGIKKLNKGLEGDDAAAAQVLLDRIEKFVSLQEKRVDDYAGLGLFVSAHNVLKSMAKSFKGLPAGDDAKSKLAEWKKDKAIKAELSAGKLLLAARDMITAGNDAGAMKLLKKIEKKHPETMTATLAKEKMELISEY